MSASGRDEAPFLTDVAVLMHTGSRQGSSRAFYLMLPGGGGGGFPGGGGGGCV